MKWYKVNGFFFDEVQADSAHFAYYKSIADYVRSFNPAYLVKIS